jgi:hypothetical protein
MDKRYQIFVSSTYADLQEERRNVIQALMEMDCIPSGMEIFPAADEEQWEFIKKVISDCDYYVLIIGGRYGSVTSEGISYTEKEYDFAVSIGLKVLAFLHKHPEEIPARNSELDPELRAKLDSFRRRVSEGRLVRFWSRADELPGLVALSLLKTIKTYPAVGWVRADRIASAEILNEVNDLRKRNLELESQVSQMESRNPQPVLDNLAGLDDELEVHGAYWFSLERYGWKAKISWREIFSLIAPYLLEMLSDATVKQVLADSVYKRTKHIDASSVSIDDQDYQTVKIQLLALGLVTVEQSKTTNTEIVLLWYLTPKGKDLLFQLRTVKSEEPTVKKAFDD